MIRSGIRIRLWVVVLSVGIVGCVHKVQVETKPVRIDVNVTARIDIYNHAENVLDVISGEKPVETVGGVQSRGEQEPHSWLVSIVYAQGEPGSVDLGQEARKAILRSRERYQKIQEIKKDGCIGENRSALLEVIPSQKFQQDKEYREMVEELVSAENKDREIIYKNDAKQKGVSIDEIKGIYRELRAKKAVAGEFVEVKDQKDQKDQEGKWRWVKKE
jgi:uncharacterized protein YdbL (DUF1318 family)